MEPSVRTRRAPTLPELGFQNTRSSSVTSDASQGCCGASCGSGAALKTRGLVGSPSTSATARNECADSGSSCGR